MKNRFHLLFTLVVLLAACNAKDPDKKDPSAEFGSYTSRLINQYFELMPGTAISAGNHAFDSVLIVPNPLYRKMVTAFCKAHLDTLKTFRNGQLSEHQRIDAQMLRDQLRAVIWYTDTFKAHEWNPSYWNVAGECAEILNGTYAPLDTRLRSLSVRLQNVGPYYESARKTIKFPTREHTELAILQHDGAADEVFGKGMLDSVAVSGLSAEEKARLQERITAANAAMKNYSNWLKDIIKLYNAENTRSFRIGRELFSRKFEHDIVSRFSAEEIYNRALNRRAELHSEMAAVSRRLWPKYFGSAAMPPDSLALIRRMIDTLSVKHVAPDSFLQAIEAQIPELVEFVSKKDLLYIDPSRPLKVRRTPAYMEGSGAGASISAPGPFDKEANTYYNVSPLTGYTPEAAESYLREYNHYILQILNIHEAIPGHYTQLVYSNQSPSLVKSIFGNGAMVEGWAVYTERMMLDNGYGNQEDEMWLMYSKWHLRSVCNTILDYSVHVLNMQEAEAKKLLMDGAFQQQAEADGKWKRATLSQVQLCSYFTGYTEIYDLRSELQQQQGDAFRLKKFHEKFLSYGSAPVKYIRELMLADLNRK